VINIDNFDVLHEFDYSLGIDCNIHKNIFFYAKNIYRKNGIREYYLSKILLNSKEVYLVFLAFRDIAAEIYRDKAIDKNISLEIVPEIRNFLLYKKAVDFAKEKHGEQTYDVLKLPYFYHLRQTDKVLDMFIAELPINKVFVLKTAAMLHDVLEDTSVSYRELEEEFTKEIADIVLAVTKEDEFNRGIVDDMNLGYECTYYKQIAQNELAIYVKMADKCANNRQNTKVLSEKRAKKSMLQHNIFKDVIYENFSSKAIKNYLESIMVKVKNLHGII
jgi:(p)ppGpp synthase/HD superfamily hydrolase